jgi:hypothetical protein
MPQVSVGSATRALTPTRQPITIAQEESGCHHFAGHSILLYCLTVASLCRVRASFLLMRNLRLPAAAAFPNGRRGGAAASQDLPADFPFFSTESRMMMMMMMMRRRRRRRRKKSKGNESRVKLYPHFWLPIVGSWHVIQDIVVLPTDTRLFRARFATSVARVMRGGISGGRSDRTGLSSLSGVGTRAAEGARTRPSGDERRRTVAKVAADATAATQLPAVSLPPCEAAPTPVVSAPPNLSATTDLIAPIVCAWSRCCACSSRSSALLDANTVDTACSEERSAHPACSRTAISSSSRPSLSCMTLSSISTLLSPEFPSSWCDGAAWRHPSGCG